MANNTDKILVIDDMATFREIIGHMLAKQGYQVVTAPDMETALIDFQKSNFKLVISDIFMPGVGGIEGIKLLRSRWPDVKIIAISGGYKGQAREDALAAAQKIGADDAIGKPFKEDELIEAVTRVIGS